MTVSQTWPSSLGCLVREAAGVPHSTTRINSKRRPVIRTVTVAQALKERRRLEAKLNQYQSLIQEQNCLFEGSKRVIDIGELMGKCDRLRKEILGVRVAVARANMAVSDKLVELDMLKRQQRFVSELPCDESMIERRGESGLLRKEAAVKAMDILKMSESLEERINAIQDALDAYNASATVQIGD